MGFLAVVIWMLIVPSTVDFDALITPTRVGAALAAAQSLAPNPVGRTLKIVLILAGALVILSHVSEARALLKRVNIFFLAFLALALMSITWSADPSATFARYVPIAPRCRHPSRFVWRGGIERAYKMWCVRY